MNQRETIDGITGEWRTVTKASEVTVGQRVRYENFEKYGYREGDERTITEVYKTDADSICIEGVNFSNAIFDGYWRNIQAFFHLPVKQKRKVAKVTIGYDFDCRGNVIFHFIIKMNRWHFMVTPKFGGAHYSSRKSALRGAQRFCKVIGWEMEVEK